jgi:hypothetical protein
VNGATIPIPDAASSIPIDVQAGASPGTISKVETYIDGILVNTDTTFPYSFAWKPTVVGTYRITALAFDDKNNVVASTPSVVTVTTGGAGGTVVGQPPIVSITTPVNGSAATVNNSVSISANASDPDGIIASVQFFVNGVALGAADTVFPYSTSWTPTALGTYNLTAKAIDNNGNVVTSAAVALSVGNRAPIVTITSPTGGATTQVGGGATPVTITATASDPDGTISGVNFFANGVQIGTRNIPPYTVTWTPTSR